jgi:hypothetical protein
LLVVLWCRRRNPLTLPVVLVMRRRCLLLCHGTPMCAVEPV